MDGEADRRDARGPFEFRMPWPPKEVTGYVFDAPVADYFGDNDDLYVGMAYLLALDRHGAGVTQVQMAAEFFRRLEPRRLWMANQRAYMNLAAGLAPPKTGHPVFNECSWAIDAQIENDVWGVVCPGMIDTACRYADLAAHVTNHADGAYGGLFTAALASGAFAERDVETLVETALAKLPPPATTRRPCGTSSHGIGRNPATGRRRGSGSGVSGRWRGGTGTSRRWSTARPS